MTLTNVKIVNPAEGETLYVAAGHEVTLEEIVAYALDPTRPIPYAVSDLGVYRNRPGMEDRYFAITNFVEIYDEDELLVINGVNVEYADVVGAL